MPYVDVGDRAHDSAQQPRVPGSLERDRGEAEKKNMRLIRLSVGIPVGPELPAVHVPRPLPSGGVAAVVDVTVDTGDAEQCECERERERERDERSEDSRELPPASDRAMATPRCPCGGRAHLGRMP